MSDPKPTWHRMDGPNPPPKDGTRVLFWSAKDGLSVAWWKTETREYWDRVTPDRQERRLETDGWWEGMYDEAIDATHWSLPEPPRD